MVWAFKVTFGILILIHAQRDNSIDFQKIPELKIVIARFICGMIMHVVAN